MSQFCPECGRVNTDKARFCMACGEKMQGGRSPLLNGRYEILKTKKSGGMGCVYQARDIQSNRIVAVKTMHTHHINQEEEKHAEGRFKEEARSLASRCVPPGGLHSFRFSTRCLPGLRLSLTHQHTWAFPKDQLQHGFCSPGRHKWRRQDAPPW